MDVVESTGITIRTRLCMHAKGNVIACMYVLGGVHVAHKLERSLKDTNSKIATSLSLSRYLPLVH